MENIKIEGKHGEYFVPTVDFNSETGVCELSGESFLEETREFYAKLLEWLKKYDETTTNKLTFNFKLTYFNTSSSRSILDILNLLKEMTDNGKEVEVNWYYQQDDEDMQEEVEDFIYDSQVEINLFPFEGGVKENNDDE